MSHTARNPYEGVWGKAAKGVEAVFRLAMKAEKKPSDTGIAQAVKKLKLKPVVMWLVLAFAEDEHLIDEVLTLGDAVVADDSVAALLAFRNKLRDVMTLVAPGRFTYSGFQVTNTERVSERLCRKTLSGVDFLAALFKKRGVPDLLRQGVTDIVILLADPLGNSGGSYNPTTRTITLDTPKKVTRGLFIEGMAHVFLHEFGHHVHLNYLHPEAVAAWDAPWDAEETPTSVSTYGQRSKEEDFAETFVAFMAAPEKLHPEAKFRMQRALSLSGLYGKPVTHLAYDYDRR